MSSTPERPTTMFSVDPDGPAVIVYSDEVSLLRQDVLLYANVYFQTDADGVAVRIDPARVTPKGAK